MQFTVKASRSSDLEKKKKKKETKKKEKKEKKESKRKGAISPMFKLPNTLSSRTQIHTVGQCLIQRIVLIVQSKKLDF